MLNTFNAYYSLAKFLKTLSEDSFDTPCFINSLLTASEEEKISTLQRYLLLDINQDSIEPLQNYFVSLALYCQPEFDSTLLWLKRFVDLFTTSCYQKQTSALSLIPIYDFDSSIGETAVTTFLTEGTFPVLALLSALSNSSLPEYLPCNQKVGLKPIENAKPVLDTNDVPYKITWRITFRYFDPYHMAGSFPL